MTRTRRNTIFSRARFRTSPQPSDSDDVNGGSSFKGGDRTRHQSPEAHEKGSDGGYGLREKSPILGENEADSSVDRLKSDACIVCDGKDNQLLVCNETGCPVSIHHRCMPEEPDFDELGNFYCPYCWYKQLVVKSLKFQEKIMMAAEECGKARDISVGVDMAVTVGRSGRKTGNVMEVDMSLGRMENLNPCENRGEDDELGHPCAELETNQQNQTVFAEIRAPGVANNDERAQGQDSDVGEGKKRRGRQGKGLRNDEEAKADLEPSISSPISTNNVNESDTSDQERSNEARSRHDPAASPKDPFFGPEKCSRRSKSYQDKTATECYDLRQRKDSAYNDKKRKRLFWTPEEEETLRDDVNGGSSFKGGDRTRHQSPEGHEKGTNGGYGLREKSPILGENEADSSVDRLKSDACIVCDGKDNQLLVCNETGCPISIHHRCMPEEPDFDELGNFYCPYCWYKQLVVKSLKLQEKIMMAAEKCEKARVISVGEDMAVTMDKNGGKTGNVMEVNMSLGRMENLNPCENRGEDDELGHPCAELETNQQNQAVAAEIHEPEVASNGERAQGQDSDVGKGRRRRRKSGGRQERGEEEEEEEENGDQSNRRKMKKTMRSRKSKRRV
ncbi:PREDICTED: uncharacterized protein LOC104815384 [Tarenaya hassleriana]|uniref:uncharacterized protein LOC104815384 n=1 Tax=Tarenaya hassleriana TaxID=28532 RepID=UPI00053C59A6|nr:PREDICTED: uncharacterized protein LOC104815384 [Tarenaya hassleriana]